MKDPGRECPAAIGKFTREKSAWSVIADCLSEYGWSIIGFFWLLALILGYKGFHDYRVSMGESVSPLHILYLSVQLFVMESGAVSGPMGWELQVARFLAPVVAAYTAFKAIAIVFYDQVQAIRLRLYSNHVVICGLGRTGTHLARGYRQLGKQVVVIEKDSDNDNIQQARDLRAIVIIGEATDGLMLEKARVEFSDKVVACTGDDGLNFEIAVKARDLAGKRDRDQLTCFVHISGKRLFDQMIRNPSMAGAERSGFRLCPFNIYNSGAEEMLKMHPPFTGDGSVPRLVVVGIGRFGQAVVAEIAIRWRLIFYRTGTKIPIEVIDRNASVLVPRMLRRRPVIGEVCDVIPNEMDVQDPPFADAAFLHTGDGNSRVSVIYICLDDDRIGLDAALALIPEAEKHGIPIIVRTIQDKGIATMLREVEDKSFSKLHAFELIAHTARPDLLGGEFEELAMEFHKGYNEFAVTKKWNTRTWEEIEESLRLSNRRQAQSAGRVLSMVGFCIVPISDDCATVEKFSEAEIDRIAEVEHERWVADLMRDGWRYGKDKNIAQRTHPDLVPWEDLNEDVRDIDRWWAQRLPKALEVVNYKVCRLV